MKQFKSASTHRTIKVHDFNANMFALVMSDKVSSDFMVSSSDAPALALAILEAAGVAATPFDEGPETEPGHAVWALRHHVQEQARATAEAKEREQLETEALELYRAHWHDRSDWAQVEHKDQWLAVARKARELNKEANK